MTDLHTVKTMGIINAARYLLEELEYMLIFDKAFTLKMKQQVKQTIKTLETVSNIPFVNEANDSVVDEQYVNITTFVRENMELHYRVTQMTHEKQLRFQDQFDNLLTQFSLI